MVREELGENTLSFENAHTADSLGSVKPKEEEQVWCICGRGAKNRGSGTADLCHLHTRPLLSCLENGPTDAQAIGLPCRISEMKWPRTVSAHS